MYHCTLIYVTFAPGINRYLPGSLFLNKMMFDWQQVFYNKINWQIFRCRKAYEKETY